MDIALLNMMPDAAVKATDRQFAGLLASHGDIRLHSFTFTDIPRNQTTAQYISDNYISENQFRALRPDALIITGANVSNPRMETQSFWQPLQETMEWARDQVPAVLCSCLSSHAVMQFRFDQRRQALPKKLWGVFDHQVVIPSHPLAIGLPQVVQVPQSRFNEVTASQFLESGLDVIIADDIPGVHLVANPDNSLVLMQGHPEYDGVSLLKEYKREVGLYFSGQRAEYPEPPVAMLNASGVKLAEAHRDLVMEAFKASKTQPEFPEHKLGECLVIPWQIASKQVFRNWLNIVSDKCKG